MIIIFLFIEVKFIQTQEVESQFKIFFFFLTNWMSTCFNSLGGVVAVERSGWGTKPSTMF